MAVVASVIAAVAGVAGAAVNYVGQQKQASAMREASRASQDAENARREQMRLEQMRKQREAFRQAQRARAVATSNVANNVGGGAAAEGGSALPGSYGQISGQLGRDTTALYANLNLGEQIFDANARVAQAQGEAATGAGISSIGQQIFGNAQAIGRIGATVANGQDSGWFTETRNAQGYRI